MLSLTQDETERIPSDLLQQYARAHHDIAAIWQEHFQRVQPYLPAGQLCGPTRQRLLGAYFTMDYALEAVPAVLNPSIVTALDQQNLLPGTTRSTLSLRAIGEGHLLVDYCTHRYRRCRA